jgi:hypothetical protein
VTQQTSDAIDVGIRIAREFGFPVVMVCILLFGLREAATALHHTVVVPVVESHSTFLRQTTATLEGLGRAQEKQAETLRELADGQREIRDAVVGRQP